MNASLLQYLYDTLERKTPTSPSTFGIVGDDGGGIGDGETIADVGVPKSRVQNNITLSKLFVLEGVLEIVDASDREDLYTYG